MLRFFNDVVCIGATRKIDLLPEKARLPAASSSRRVDQDTKQKLFGLDFDVRCSISDILLDVQCPNVRPSFDVRFYVHYSMSHADILLSMLRAQRSLHNLERSKILEDVL